MKRENSFHKNPHDDPNIIGSSLPQPEIRVKFPKLLMKSMQRRRNHRGSNGSNVDQKEATENGDFLRKRISFITLSACSSKKAQEMSSSGNQPLEIDNADDSILKNIQDSCEEKIHGENSGEVDKKLVEMPTKISRFIRKRIGVPFRKLKLDEKSNDEASQKKCSKSLDEFRRKKSIYRRITSGKSVLEKVLKCDGGEEEEERSEVELCKKRILMGEKCRPLNLSGVLHYDTDGVLLPEEVL
ncbi:unnamed protein product [Fraxinus pennsylvanica]|uniref:Uncharacterized protein n=1 Tax=Fraxinus pennsylvanica TaxID=56036 RepID=A0AAD2DWZ8_9LAMI|nr:unnamed protein product [Fraxinus pennsylvanica]